MTEQTTTDPPRIVALIIGRSMSRCSACGGNAIPGYGDDTAHVMVSGYEQKPGCGATWTHVTTDSNGGEADARSMAPHLPWIDPDRVAEQQNREVVERHRILAERAAGGVVIPPSSLPADSDPDRPPTALDVATRADYADIARRGTRAYIDRFSETLRQEQARHQMAEAELVTVRSAHAAELREVNGLLAEARTHVERLRAQQWETLDEIAAERERQDAKWGQQNHPDGTGPDVRWQPGIQSTATAAVLADALRARCKAHAASGVVTFLDILMEEVAEAFAESDPAKLRTELVQVAAVATAWVEAIDRRDIAEILRTGARGAGLS